MSYRPLEKSESKIEKAVQGIQEHKSGLFKLIISVFYLVGIIGMSFPVLKPYFQALTPFHLLLSLGILLLFHSDWNRYFMGFSISAYLIGFGSEVLGVHTGFPFGNYEYGSVLGIKLLDVPLMIGVNWLLLVYLTGNLFEKRVDNDFLAAALGAGLMVIIDFIIEPVAIGLEFWSWEGEIIPLSNYMGWFVVAYFIHLIYRRAMFEKKNLISGFLLLNLIIFFAVLNFIL
ncbi:carotenoid biosynthesis protein [Aquiflexum sp.]|uniref:carotenoid biosynthesis protein n=1 Tax=Aquiflexum sp. TaxID=1872584 RepID=UPI003593A514